ncbi:hypothetical protein HRbin34_00094 [bacterium HR34]|nr:hypothetical protein HRbin34_00094 [bacterium HR34]
MVDYKEFLEYIIKGIVNNPDKVEIEKTVDEMGVLLTVKAHPSDVGLIIGKKGSVAQAIRALTRIVGLKNKARVNIKIEQPNQ